MKGQDGVELVHVGLILVGQLHHPQPAVLKAPVQPSVLLPAARLGCCPVFGVLGPARSWPCADQAWRHFSAVAAKPESWPMPHVCPLRWCAAGGADWPPTMHGVSCSPSQVVTLATACSLQCQKLGCTSSPCRVVMITAAPPTALPSLDLAAMTAHCIYDAR